MQVGNNMYSAYNKNMKANNQNFFNSKAFKMLMNRWAGKDMETYFEEKSKKHLETLKNELENKKK
jgi:hypothetical protein